jgi:L,D-peptidoglycan transpeptidase YkuD (ErfK/YbiS/YcfS/YnhG family)
LTYTSIDTTNINLAQQLIVVTTAGWDSVKGQMWYFDKNQDGRWLIVKKNQPVVVGKSGLAWADVSYKNLGKSPLKKEGDNNVPAGIFKLGRTFGFGDEDSSNPRFIQLKTGIECIDDSRSKFYNEIINTKNFAKDWDSSEKMSEVSLYKYGIEVLYNHNPSTPKLGSCIFMHIWRSPNTGTEGCTAMSENDIKNLQQWINGDKQTALVQLPQNIYNHVQANWSLPNLPKENN